MKKLFLSLLLCMPITFVHAQTRLSKNVRVLCDTTDRMYTILSKEFKEVPFLMAETIENENTDEKSYLTFWKNDSTKTWSVIFTDNDISCMIMAGKNFAIEKGEKL